MCLSARLLRGISCIAPCGNRRFLDCTIRTDCSCIAPNTRRRKIQMQGGTYSSMVVVYKITITITVDVPFAADMRGAARIGARRPEPPPTVTITFRIVLICIVVMCPCSFFLCICGILSISYIIIYIAAI